MAKMKECPVCGIGVKLENLETHIKNVHPRVNIDAHLSEDDKTDIKIARKKKKKTASPFDERERRRWAIAGILVTIVVIVVIFAFILLPPSGDVDIIGEPAPAFTYGDVNGEVYDLNAHIGSRPILIEFFFTECHWCIEMAPNMNELYAYYGFGSQVEFVSVSGSNDDTLQTVRDFMTLHGSNWTHIKSPESLSSTYQIQYTPTFVVIDKGGIVREFKTGFKSVEDMKELLEDYL